MRLASIKRAVGNAYFRLQAVLGAYRVARRSLWGKSFTGILMYHGLERDPRRLRCNPLDVRPEACFREVRFHVRQGYRLISPDELTEPGSPHGNTVGDPRLLIVFDDGHLNTFEPLRSWLERHPVPILLAICPGVIERGEMYWCEEVQARLSLLRRDEVVLEAGAEKLRFTPHEGHAAVRRFCEWPRGVARQLLEQLRQETSYIGEDELRRSPYVHANMGWEELRQLVRTGRCTIAAHSLHHDVATQMTVAKLEWDARECKRLIEERLQVPCGDYVYPFGSEPDFSPETDDVLRQCGFRRTYTTVHHLNADGRTTALGRFQAAGYDGSLRYYGHLWGARHRAEAVR
jgi:peptidoglycan/xylan/chitin deacetylase (PgdA/CDA1 family)